MLGWALNLGFAGGEEDDEVPDSIINVTHITDITSLLIYILAFFRSF